MSIIILLIPAFAYGITYSIKNIVLQQLFSQWLQGKPVGIVILHVIPVDSKGLEIYDNFKYLVRNFTDYEIKTHSTIVYFGRSSSISLNIYRVPLRYGIDDYGKGPRVIYKEHQYLITVYGNGFFGSKLIQFEPKEPITEMYVKVTLRQINIKGVPLETEEYEEVPPHLEETKEEVQHNIPAIQAHSIDGITVTPWYYRGNYLYYTQKYRYLDTNNTPVSGWYSSGAAITKAEDTFTPNPSYGVSNGVKRWMFVDVRYRYERWYYPDEEVKEEIVTPVSFTGYAWGWSISCSLCGGNIVGWNGHSQVSPFYLCLGPGLTSRIEESGIKVSFTVSYGNISLTVELWYAIKTGESSNPPKLRVDVNNWVNSSLWYFDANTNKKVIHFTWNQP